MSDELVHLSVDRAVATLTLDNQPKRNALSQQLVADLHRHLETVENDDGVRAVVLAAAGSVWCSGADLSEMPESGIEGGTKAMVALFRRLVALPQPVIAKVHATVRAGGIGLVGAADIALVGDDVTFAFTEARLGVAPAMISLTTLSRMDERAAAELFLTGAKFDSAEAARIGLVTRAVPAAALNEAVDAVLEALRQCSPQGLRETKSLLAAPILARIDADGEALAAQSGRLFASDEAREGITALFEKRKPSWAV